MKKRNQILGIIAMLCVGMLFTSCTKDEKLSNRLSGTWEGDWGMSYVDRDGIQHNSHYTVIEFHSDKIFETQGYGYQEDYYEDGPFEKIGLYFNWSINHQVINITYPPGYSIYNCSIRDYVMEKKRFTGYIGDTYFRLNNLTKDYKWYDYAGFYTATTLAGTTAVLLWAWECTDPIYYDDYYGYYAKTRGADAPEASPITMPDGTTVQPASENCPIRIFNRFAEQDEQ